MVDVLSSLSFWLVLIGLCFRRLIERNVNLFLYFFGWTLAVAFAAAAVGVRTRTTGGDCGQRCRRQIIHDPELLQRRLHSRLQEDDRSGLS